MCALLRCSFYILHQHASALYLMSFHTRCLNFLYPIGSAMMVHFMALKIVCNERLDSRAGACSLSISHQSYL